MLFHERHRDLLFMSAFGGLYLPSLSRIIPWKPVNIFLKGYAAAVTAGALFLITFEIRQLVFLSENLIVQIWALNNLLFLFFGFSRTWYLNVNRDEVQRLYDQWDGYFQGDGHDKTRKKLLDDLKKPYKKYVYGCGILLSVMMVAWAAEQFTHDDYELSIPIGVPYTRKNPDYLILATYLFVFQVVYGPMVLCVDVLVMEPMTWITAEFIRLQQLLADILNTIQIRENGTFIHWKSGTEFMIRNKQELESDFGKVDANIKKWIIEHQKLFIFHQKMVAVYQWPLAIHFICTQAQMCLISYLLALGVLTPMDQFFTLLGQIPTYMLFFITARYGDHLQEHAERVFDFAFTTNWTIYPKSVQKNLHIIAMRLNYPLIINIMKQYPLGSETFFMILQSAYTIFSFLVTLTDQQEIK